MFNIFLYMLRVLAELSPLSPLEFMKLLEISESLCRGPEPRFLPINSLAEKQFC